LPNQRSEVAKPNPRKQIKTPTLQKGAKNIIKI
jgi:hypothetical protein